MTDASLPRSAARRRWLPTPPRLYRVRRLLDMPAVLQRRRLAPVRAAFYDALWGTAAEQVGAEAQPAAFGLTRIQRGGLATFVRRSDIMLDDALTVLVVSDKLLCYDLFRSEELPVPNHIAVTSDGLGEAEAFLERLDRPVVVKPLAGTGGGRGVTTGITGSGALYRAARYASGYGSRLLIEEEIRGPSYRLLYLDGQFIDAVRRDSPTVVGDGQRTIRQLVRAENQRRLTQPCTALSPLRIDEDMRNTLARAGRSLSSRPGRDERVTVKGAVNENASRENHAISTQIHPDIIERIGRLVRALNVRFAGVDLLGGDLSLPLADSGAVVNEVNANPGIHHHVLISDPHKGVPVAQKVLEHLFDNKVGVMEL